MNNKLLLLPLTACLVVACAVDPPRIEPPQSSIAVQPARPSETDRLLAYLVSIRKLDARAINSERELVRSTLLAEKTDFNRVKLAALLMPSQASTTSNASAASVSDDAELIAVLEPVIQALDQLSTGLSPDSKAAEIRALALLMHGAALDRKRARDQLRDAQAKLSAIRRDDSKDVEARALRTRVTELERKIAALTSIDRSVNQRADTPK